MKHLLLWMLVCGVPTLARAQETPSPPGEEEPSRALEPEAETPAEPAPEPPAETTDPDGFHAHRKAAPDGNSSSGRTAPAWQAG